MLLAVTAGEYASICSSYPSFNLPADMASINIIEIAPDQLSVANLEAAITSAAATTLPDLVVLRTTDMQNTIAYAGSADELAVNIAASQGAISIVGSGTRPLTLDAGAKCRVMSVGGSNSTTTVNLGGMVLARGVVTGSSYGGGINQSYGTLNLHNIAISNNMASSKGGGMYQANGTSTLTNVTICANAAGTGGGVYLASGNSTLANVTVSGNTVSGSYSEGGGVYVYSGRLSLRNTLVARNGGYSPDLGRYGGTITAASSLIGDGSGQSAVVNGANGNLVGTSLSPIDPMIAEGSSAGIGLSPLPGSPAVDAGDNSLISPGFGTDIYGAARIQGDRVNIGAVETVLAGTPGATYVVTSLADSIGADGVVTLREALAAANSNQAVGNAPAGSYSAADRIEFSAGLIGTIMTNGHPYQITGSVTLVGPGESQLTLDAGGSGGVMDIRGAYDVSVSGMALTGGNAPNGGGICAIGAHLALDHLAINGNRASSCGGGAYLYAGTSLVTNVTISGNRAGSGGGLYLHYGVSTVTDVTISGNWASDGGGVCLFDGMPVLTNVTISGNGAQWGGGVYQSSGTSTITNVIITGNTADQQGGGWFQYDGVSTLTNLTIFGNTGPSSGGGAYLASGSLSLRNTIVARNVADTAPDIRQAGGALIGANNLIGDATGQSALTWANGNLGGTSSSPMDPMLAEGDRAGTALSPVTGSPAIDAGNNSLIPTGVAADVYGAARIQGARVNIGAVETVLRGIPGVTYVVTSLADSVAADGVLTLREALAAANSNQEVGDAPSGSYSSADRIEFGPALIGSILTHGQAYQIIGSLVLVGPGASQLTLDAGGNGGVVDIRGPYEVNISGMTLSGGNAAGNGGIYAWGAHLVLDHLVISGNAATWGGGVYMDSCAAMLTNVTISGNSALNYGGGIYQSSGTSTLTNVIISGNTASSYGGGGMYLYRGTSTLTNVVISGNTTIAPQCRGGGLYQYYGTSTLTNVTISGNTAAPGSSGGGMCLIYGTSTLMNTIVAQNTAPSGPDIYKSSGTLSGANDLIGNGSGPTSLVNGVSGNLVGTSSSPIDPRFVSMAGTDWAAWDLRLQATSPAVNAGNNAWIPTGVTTDTTGGPRILGGTVDMGAYEMDRPPTDVALSATTCAENQPSGTVVGTLTTADPDAEGVSTYSLVNGTGSDDNASFTISGSQLLTAASFDYETKRSYSIRARTTDQGGLWFESTFTISVLNVADVVPTITGISTDTGTSSSDGITSDSTLLINGISEPGMTITVYRGGVLAGTTSANGSGNWVFDYTGTSLGEGSYNFTATASDTLGDTTAASALYAVTIDGTAPALPTASINDGAAQRSMVKKLALSFGEKVVLGTGAVTVKKSDGSDVPDTTLLVTNPSGDQRNYVLSFSGIGVVGGSLADGIYDLSVAAAGVHDLAGNALGGNFSQRFHRLYGDYDGNKTVNNGDYFWFKQTFNKNTGDTGFLDLCDYDANGTVNNGDYFQFKKRFGVVYTY